MLTLRVKNGFEDFLASLKAMKDERLLGKSDLIVDATHLRFLDGETVELLTPDGIQTLKITDWAKRQISNWLGIPITYYEKMSHEANTVETDILPYTMKYWLQKEEGTRKLIRTLTDITDHEKKIIAVLSDHYRPIDNYDVVNVVFNNPTIRSLYEQKKLLFNYSYVTDKYMNIMIHDMSHQYHIPDNENDTYHVGISIKNSEVGAAQFTVEPALYRTLCGNSLIMTLGFGDDDNSTIKKRHVGKKMTDLGDIWSRRTKDLDDMTLLSKVNDVINASLDPDTVQIAIEKLAESKKKTLSPTWVKYTASVLNLTDDENQNIWRNVRENTRYDFIQATTQFARDLLQTDDKKLTQNIVERATELQKQAWSFLSDDVWDEVAEAEEKDKKNVKEKKNE